MRKSEWAYSFSRYKLLYLLLIPSVAYYVIFHYIPLYGIVLAFKDFRISMGVFGSPWADPLFRHFTSIFAKEEFWRAVSNTFIISLYKIVFCFPAPIILALLLNEVAAVRFKKVIQTMMYFPHFISWVVLGGVIINMLSTNGGTVNELLAIFNVQPKQYISDTQWFRSILVISDIWKTAGWGTIIYLAALAGVDLELYESANIDGANRIQRLWYITLPQIMSTVAVMLVLTLGNIMNVGFEQVFILYSVPVYNVADILDTYVYRIGIVGMKYSMATAVGLFKSVIGLIFIMTSNSIVKKMGQQGIY